MNNSSVFPLKCEHTVYCRETDSHSLCVVIYHVFFLCSYFKHLTWDKSFFPKPLFCTNITGRRIKEEDLYKCKIIWKSAVLFTTTSSLAVAISSNIQSYSCMFTGSSLRPRHFSPVLLRLVHTPAVVVCSVKHKPCRTGCICAIKDTLKTHP